MATVPPPPPPPPPSCGNQPPTVHPPPCPKHAALPFPSKETPPVQETSGSQEAIDDSQGAPVPNGPQSPPSQEPEEDNLSDSEDKGLPVQETDPAPQALNNPQLHETTEPEQDEGVTQMDEAGED